MLVLVLVHMGSVVLGPMTGMDLMSLNVGQASVPSMGIIGHRIGHRRGYGGCDHTRCTLTPVRLMMVNHSKVSDYLLLLLLLRPWDDETWVGTGNEHISVREHLGCLHLHESLTDRSSVDGRLNVFRPLTGAAVLRVRRSLVIRGVHDSW